MLPDEDDRLLKEFRSPITFMFELLEILIKCQQLAENTHWLLVNVHCGILMPDNLDILQQEYPLVDDENPY
jgi:hypothetical protein